MSEQIIALSELCEVITKGTTPTTLGYEFQEEGIGFLKIECFNEAGDFMPDKMVYISEECNEKLKRSQLKQNDILFSIAGAIGRVAIISEDMLPANTNQALAIIRINKENIYIPYIKLILTSNIVKEQYDKQKQGVAQLNLSLKDVGDLRIPICSFEEQIQYVKLFDNIKELVSLYNSQLKAYDTLVKSRFVEMFGDISKDEYKYETRKLGEVAKVGSSHRVFTNEFVVKGIPFYRGTEIGELANGQEPTESYYISEEHYERLSSDETKPQIGDLLMPSICNKGQVWMVDTDKPFYYKDGRVICISPNRDIYDSRYLQYYMRIKTEVEYPKIGSGSTFAEFKIFLLKDLDILTPPKEVQEQFALFIDQVNKLKDDTKNSLMQLETLEMALMQQYFSESHCK